MVVYLESPLFEATDEALEIDDTPAGDEPKDDGTSLEDVDRNGNVGDLEVDESRGNDGSVDGDETPDGSDDCEKRLDGMMMPGGNELGLKTRIVVVASGSNVFKTVVLLK